MVGRVETNMTHSVADRYFVLGALTLSLAFACSDSAPSGECGGNRDCATGEVCVDQSCYRVCSVDSQCIGTAVCDQNICRPGSRSRAPEVSTLDGDGAPLAPTANISGTPATRRLRQSLKVTGTALEGADAALVASDGTSRLLTVQQSSETGLTAQVPSDLTPGMHTLRVYNAVGANENTVWVVQGEQGVQGSQGLQGPPGPVLAGLTWNTPATSCKNAQESGLIRTGRTWIRPSDASAGQEPQEFWCEQTLEGGGWTLVYNSVLGTNTTDFWNIPYAQRLSRRGRPEINSNFYDGSLYQRGLEFMDVVEDLAGTVQLATLVRAGSFNPTTMVFANVTVALGGTGWGAVHFGSGWSAPDYDGDVNADNCATLYANVTQHYGSCWTMNLGSDADAPASNYRDGGVGPHVVSSWLGTYNLVSDGTGYSRVRRISRYVRW